MAAYVDYAFYTGTFHGTAIAQSDFDRFASRASLTIDKFTFGRAAPIVTAGLDLATIEKIKLATCAVADKINSLETSGGAIQSERVGNVSVTYADARSEGARLVDEAKLYLWETGLMFPGFTELEQ